MAVSPGPSSMCHGVQGSEIVPVDPPSEGRDQIAESRLQKATPCGTSSRMRTSCSARMSGRIVTGIQQVAGEGGSPVGAAGRPPTYGAEELWDAALQPQPEATTFAAPLPCRWLCFRRLLQNGANKALDHERTVGISASALLLAPRLLRPVLYWLCPELRLQRSSRRTRSASPALTARIEKAGPRKPGTR